MSRPLLTKVLADALLQTFCWDRRPEAVGKDTEVVIAAIPPDIADRLERALDVCQHLLVDGLECGQPPDDDVHIYDRTHLYQPLVTP
jgi:hypothetical protein